MQNALVAAANTKLAAAQNSIVSSTTSGIQQLQSNVIAHSNTQEAAIIANQNAQAAAIEAEIDADANAVMANLDTDSAAVINVMLQIGCEDLRLQNSSQRTSSLAVCSQPNQADVGPVTLPPVNAAPPPSTSSSGSSSGTSSSSSSTGSSATQATSSNTAAAGGCSAIGSEQSVGNLPTILMLLVSAIFLRKRRLLNGGLFSLLMIVSLSANAQTTPTVQTFASQLQSSIQNLQQYFQAQGRSDMVNMLQGAADQLANTTYDQLSAAFAQVPPDANGNSIPDLSKLVDATQMVATNVATAQTAPADLLTPPNGFPPFGRNQDFCPTRVDSAAIYALSLANDIINVVMSVLEFFCLQGVPIFGDAFTDPICIALSIVQSALNVTYGTIQLCTSLEASPPTYEAFSFLADDILNQFGLLSNKSLVDSNQISLKVNAVTDSVTTNLSNLHDQLLAATNANISAAQNSVIADAAIDTSGIQNAIAASTTTALSQAQTAIDQHTDTVASAIIANANQQATAIIAKARQDAQRILDKVRTDANQIIGTIEQIGCQDIAAMTQSVPLSSVSICASQPGF